jgi:hypothetical protein
MPIERTGLIRGPGFISYAAQSIFAAGDIVANLVEEWSDAVTAGYGRIGRRLKNRMVEVTAQPLLFASLTTLYPYAAFEPGDPLFGMASGPLVIAPRNGRPLTLVNAAVTKLAPLKLTARPPLIAGPTVWTGLVAAAADPGQLASYFTQGSVGSNATLTGFVAANAIGRRFSAVRDGVALLADDAGFAIDFPMSLEPDQPDGMPVIGMRLKALDATVKFTPVGMLESAYLALMNNSVGIGDSPTAYDLAISGAFSGDPTVTIANTRLQPGGWAYGGQLRNARLTFESIRAVASNALTALWTFGTV